MTKLIQAISDLIRIDTRNLYTRAYMEEEMKIIRREDYQEFIKIIMSVNPQFKKPADIFQEAINVYKSRLQSELFKNVPQMAQESAGRFRALFRQVEGWFDRHSGIHDEVLAQRIETPRKYLQQCKISAGEFWTKYDVAAVNQIRMGRLYTIEENPYQKLEETLEEVIKNELTKEVFSTDQKALGNESIKKLSQNRSF